MTQNTKKQIKNIFLQQLIIIIYLFNTISCSTFNHIIYQPPINQGNLLKKNDIEKIHTGMKKNTTISLLGTPTLSDPFGSNTHFYIFYKKSHNRQIIQNTLTLKFDHNDTLISIHCYKKD